jgi:FkbM family methyltransferase
MTGATIHLLDPSPTGIQTYQQAKSSGVIYHEKGLSGESKKHTFALPRNPAEGSYKDPRFDSEGMETVTFDCVSVDDFMKQHNMNSVDLLKMDIEGFEYEVLRSILRNKTRVRQICVEFHNLNGALLSGIIRYLWIIRLRLHGYSLISHVGTTDHTFMRL